MVIKELNYAILASGAAEVTKKFRITPIAATEDAAPLGTKTAEVSSKPLKKLSHAPRACSSTDSLNKMAPFKYWRG